MAIYKNFLVKVVRHKMNKLHPKNISENLLRLEGSEHSLLNPTKRVGRVKATESFCVTVVLRRRPDGDFMPAVGSLKYLRKGHQRRLSKNTFIRKYGTYPKDISRVRKFAKNNGLKISCVNRPRRIIILSGNTRQFERAFSVKLHYYKYSRKDFTGQDLKNAKKTFRGREGFIYIPKYLIKRIIGVFGLDNRYIGRRNTNGFSGNVSLLTVPTVAKLYNFPTNSAAGQTIAIFSISGYLPQDVQTYFQSLPGYYVPRIIDVPNDGNIRCADPETTQDICIVGSVAQGANIAVYYAPTNDQQGWVNLISRAIHPESSDPVCSVLSCSFLCLKSDDLNASFVNALNHCFSDAHIQGVTVCAASGDYGSDCNVGDGQAHVEYPASDPFVLSCGGTAIQNLNGNSFDEFVWNDDTGATGGGISNFFTEANASLVPSYNYQKIVNVPKSVNDGHVGRGVPDVSANASLHSGYSITCGGQGIVVGGTSAAAPLYAGLIAVINAALKTNVGFINAKLYANATTVTRRISGPPGPVNNRFNGAPGYPATIGWNACTGLGAINGNAFLVALAASS